MTHEVSDPPACHNCGATLTGRFCAACGQEARPLDPSLRDATRDILHELLDVDGRIFRSVRYLFLAPGFLTREQFEGRRARWISPLRLYLIFSVAYFAALSLGGSNLRIDLTGDTPAAKQAELREHGFETQEQMREAALRALTVWMPRVMFVLVPFFAWLVSRVRRSAGRGLPQHLLFALHAQAAWFGASALSALGRYAVPLLGEAFNGLTVLYGIVYVCVGLRTAYAGTTRRALRDTVIVLGVYGATLAAATLGIAFAAVVWHR